MILLADHWLEQSSGSGSFKPLCFPCPHGLASALSPSKTLHYYWDLCCNNGHHHQQESNSRGLQLTCWAGEHGWRLELHMSEHQMCGEGIPAPCRSSAWFSVFRGSWLSLAVASSFALFPLQRLCQGCQLMVPSPLAVVVCVVAQRARWASQPTLQKWISFPSAKSVLPHLVNRSGVGKAVPVRRGCDVQTGMSSWRGVGGWTLVLKQLFCCLWNHRLGNHNSLCSGVVLYIPALEIQHRSLFCRVVRAALSLKLAGLGHGEHVPWQLGCPSCHTCAALLCCGFLFQRMSPFPAGVGVTAGGVVLCSPGAKD